MIAYGQNAPSCDPLRKGPRPIMRNNIILSLNHELCSSKVNYNYIAPDTLLGQS